MTPCAVTPCPLYAWHKANAVDSIANVKSIHLDHTVFVSKLSSELSIQVRIALGAPPQCQLEDAPLLHICCAVCKCHSCCSYSLNSLASQSPFLPRRECARCR